MNGDPPRYEYDKKQQQKKNAECRSLEIEQVVFLTCFWRKIFHKNN